MSEKTPEDQDPKPDLNPDAKEVSNEVAKEISLEEVDAILAAEDPEFLNNINNIKIDVTQVTTTNSDGIDIESHISQSIKIYVKRPFDFKNNTRNVVVFWSLALVLIISLFAAWKVSTNLLHQDLFLATLEHLDSGKVQSYNPNTDTEEFYDNPRFAKNLISMSPINVNLKPSENSGDNPMLAFEVVVEGLSSDAIIEIKDRQAEFKDMLARLAEGKTYDELVVAEGKRTLCEQYRDLLNANLTLGQVRRVLLKTFIIKP